MRRAACGVGGEGRSGRERPLRPSGERPGALFLRVVPQMIQEVIAHTANVRAQ